MIIEMVSAEIEKLTHAKTARVYPALVKPL